MKKTALFLSFVFLTAIVYAHQDFKVSDFMTADNIHKVLNGEILTRMYIKYNSEGEATDLELPIPSTKYAPVDYTKYQMITDEKAFLPYDLTEDSKLEMYNVLTSASKLKGMNYYSRRAGQIKKLILDAYPIDERGRKTEDKQFTEISPHISGRFKQRDNKFGTLTFDSHLYNIENDFVLINTCDTAIPFVCKPGEYQTITYFMYDSENKGYFIYSVFLLVINSDFLINGKGPMTLNPTTFSNRLRAATVHMASLLKADWSDKYSPWDNEKMRKGEYKNY